LETSAWEQLASLLYGKSNIKAPGIIFGSRNPLSFHSLDMWKSFGICKGSIGGFFFKVGRLVLIPFQDFGFLGKFLSVVESFLILILIQKNHCACQINLLHFLFSLISSFLICCLVFLYFFIFFWFSLLSCSYLLNVRLT
jgi:hypothetical protein